MWIIICLWFYFSSKFPSLVFKVCTLSIKNVSVKNLKNDNFKSNSDVDTRGTKLEIFNAARQVKFESQNMRYKTHIINVREPRKSKWLQIQPASANYSYTPLAAWNRCRKLVSSCVMPVALIAVLTTNNGASENILTLLLVICVAKQLYRQFLKVLWFIVLESSLHLIINEANLLWSNLLRTTAAVSRP